MKLHESPSLGPLIATALRDPIIFDRRSSVLGRWLRGMLIGMFLAIIAAGHANSVLQLNLKDLCDRADGILRATVIDIKPGTVEAGGGKIPTVTYRLRVKETIGGQPRGVVDLTMVGNIKGEAAQGGVRRFPLFTEIPRLEQGQDYLLFTTRPSRIGLSTTVGLGQGSFKIFTQGKKEYAVNSAQNRDLGLVAAGPVEYVELVKRIRELRGN
jgi:hypothetical protein